MSVPSTPVSVLYNLVLLTERRHGYVHQEDRGHRQQSNDRWQEAYEQGASPVRAEQPRRPVIMILIALEFAATEDRVLKRGRFNL